MTLNADCHYGDHDLQKNGRCKWCDHFSGGWLAYQAEVKAERLGLTHGDHRHRSVEAKATCRRETRYPWLSRSSSENHP